jgi:hypothetical protein
LVVKDDLFTESMRLHNAFGREASVPVKGPVFLMSCALSVALVAAKKYAYITSRFAIHEDAVNARDTLVGKALVVDQQYLVWSTWHSGMQNMKI